MESDQELLRRRAHEEREAAMKAGRSSEMGSHFNGPAEQLKREARLFQDDLRRALATPPDKPTKSNR
jgi:hypothetical protein